MKLIKSMAIFSLAALLGVSANVNAETKKAEPAKKTTHAKKAEPAKKTAQAKPAGQVKQAISTKQAAPVKKAATAKKKATLEPIQQFNNAVGLKFLGVNTITQNGQEMLIFKYDLTNTSKKNIKKVHWTNHYFQNGKVVWSLDAPVNFETSLKPNGAVSLNLPVPFAEIKKRLAGDKVELQSQFQARSVEFTDGTKVIVP